MRPHLDYGDILYDQAFNISFQQKIETVQYNACLAITVAIRGTSREKLYQELGFESLERRRWFRKLCNIYKLIKNESPPYHFESIPKRNTSYRTRNKDDIPLLKTNHQFFKNSLFPAHIIECNKLDIAL